MQKRRFWALTTLVSLFVVLSLVLSACGATPTATPTKATAAPTAVPKATNTAVPAGPIKGGKVTMAVWQSPITLNQLLGTQTVMDEVHVLVVEGFTGVMPNGDRFPVLAKEVPTVQNGGVSADGKTITYKLKDGLKWSDGTPLTCADVQFTQEAIMTPGVGIVSTTGYSDVDKVECPDANTVVIKMKTFYAPYLTLFDNLIMPKHYCGDPKDMKNWAYNRKPMGTGPFKIDEWVADSHIILSKNTNYREAGKPYLDQFVIRIVPSSEVAMQLLQSGEVDIMWNNTEADYPQLQKMAGVIISDPVQIGGERMFLNMAENKDPSDPTKPHAILSDVRVRQAIGLGINKQRIIDKLLNGKALPGSSELNAGYFTCTNVKAYAYDPEAAKKLLEAAGWVVGSDGIRVSKGVKTTPDGTRLRLKFSTTSGNKLREDSQVLIVEDMKAIGIDMFIENAPSSVVIGSWDAGSPRRHGNFDIIMYTTNASIDPHSQMTNLWASWMIPTEQNKGGLNYTRFSDPKADDLLKKAALEPDPAKRKDMYCQLAQMTYDTANMIYLYQRMDLDSYRDWLQGWVPNAWDNNAWNAEDWWIKK
jgi:peptide/nickel transport system substrate-binding protein